MKADENKAFYMNEIACKIDRALFVHNLGDLLSQTREGIQGCSLADDGEHVIIRYAHGSIRTVDIAMDSYIAIIRDVTKHI